MNVTSKELKALGKSFENEFPVRAGLIILAAAELARLTAIEQACQPIADAVREGGIDLWVAPAHKERFDKITAAMHEIAALLEKTK